MESSTFVIIRGNASLQRIYRSGFLGWRTCDWAARACPAGWHTFDVRDVKSVRTLDSPLSARACRPFCHAHVTLARGSSICAVVINFARSLRGVARANRGPHGRLKTDLLSWATTSVFTTWAGCIVRDTRLPRGLVGSSRSKVINVATFGGRSCAAHWALPLRRLAICTSLFIKALACTFTAWAVVEVRFARLCRYGRDYSGDYPIRGKVHDITTHQLARWANQRAVF